MISRVTNKGGHGHQWIRLTKDTIEDLRAACLAWSSVLLNFKPLYTPHVDRGRMFCKPSAASWTVNAAPCLSVGCASDMMIGFLHTARTAIGNVSVSVKSEHVQDEQMWSTVGVRSRSTVKTAHQVRGRRRSRKLPKPQRGTTRFPKVKQGRMRRVRGWCKLESSVSETAVKRGRFEQSRSC